jgi:hypothetical protein
LRQLIVPLVAILLPDDSADFSSSYPKHGRGGGAGMGMTDDWPLIMIDCQVGFDDSYMGPTEQPPV